ncbi:hypothetical protein [Photorhabdus bodei]|nr:hypothetical protein [Photorhabdus bodei]
MKKVAIVDGFSSGKFMANDFIVELKRCQFFYETAFYDDENK